MPKCRILLSLGEGEGQEAINSDKWLSKRVSTSPPVPVVFRSLLCHIVKLQGNTYIFEIRTWRRINPHGTFSPTKRYVREIKGTR